MKEKKSFSFSGKRNLFSAFTARLFIYFMRESVDKIMEKRVESLSKSGEKSDKFHSTTFFIFCLCSSNAATKFKGLNIVKGNFLTFFGDKLRRSFVNYSSK